MTYEHTRRNFLAFSGAAGTALGLTALGTGTASAAAHGPGAGADPWARAHYIAGAVQGPRFPACWFDVTDYGAEADGTTDCTSAFRDAIAACHDAGGGHVLVPEGRFLTGPIHLRSKVDLHVSSGAVIAFTQDTTAYLPAVYTRWEGVELYNYSPLIYAYGQHDIAVTGKGTLDGQADDQHWWPWKSDDGESQRAARDRLFQMAEDGVPVEERVFGEGDYLRPSFVEPYRCENVLIEGVTIIRSPMWEIHPTLSRDVLVRGVTVKSHGPNNDGCNPESSSMVVIRDCEFDTGDDCVAIKSGRNADGRRVGVPSEDILIEGCRMRDGHGGVTIGSEMSGGAGNVFVRDCAMSSPNLDIALRFKTNSVRGGYIRGYYARDLEIGEVGGAVIDINFYYEEGPGHGFNPEVGGIDVRDVRVTSATRALNLRGYPDDHIKGVALTRVDFGTTTEPSVVEYVDDLVLDQVTENGAPFVPPTGTA